jgi:hypothetical protein
VSMAELSIAGECGGSAICEHEAGIAARVQKWVASADMGIKAVGARSVMRCRESGCLTTGTEMQVKHKSTRVQGQWV